MRPFSATTVTGRVVRGGLLRLLPLEVGELGVVAAEAADADADDRVADRDAEAVVDQAGAVARRAVERGARALDERVLDVRVRDAGRDEDERDEQRREQRGAAPDDREQHDDGDDQPGEARLRVREQEPDPDRDDRGDGRRARSGATAPRTTTTSAARIATIRNRP